MKIVCVSDTHGFHNELEIEECDMIIHAGDFSNYRDPAKNNNECLDFFEWFDNLDIKYKILIAGNHDTAVERRMVNPRNYSFTYLEHELVEVEGIRIFGSPYTPYFNDWAFSYKRNIGEKLWSVIPECDIIVNHGVPKGIQDLAPRGNLVELVGCKALLNKVLEIEPLLCIGGHIHDFDNIKNYGVKNIGTKTTFINASITTHGRKLNKPIVINL